ncbi:MAG: flagellar biosynthetic protein FliR [Bdellovibrionales bacterium]|nr:flagellar biosynthetic protein FliR [Bdellovibrionales bacterium]
MLSYFNFNEYEVLAFFLVLIRLSAFIVSWPVFDAPSIPMPVKILFSLVLSFLIFPLVGHDKLENSLLENQIILLAIREAFIGLAFGYLAKMFFFAIRIAGEIISVSIGLSSSQLFNPAFGSQVSSIEQLKLIVGSLFFLSINGHHLLLMGLVDTFRILPLELRMIHFDQFVAVGTFVQEITVVGLKIASPVLISIFFMNMTMAIVGRTVPQINVLITSLPVNILLGFTILFVSMPLLVWQMHDLLDLTTSRVFSLMRTF